MQWAWAGIGAAGLALGASTPALAEVVITEIMYDPASSERAPVKTEWVELCNTGDQAVDLAGWYLTDEDAQTEPLPQGVSIAPGQVIVLIPGGCSARDFQAAWGRHVRAYPLGKWSGGAGTLGLANNPTETNEILTLRDADHQTVDEVNYQETSPWPAGKVKGASIYLLPGSLSTARNDEGKRWRFAEAETHGARNANATDIFDAEDTGSPGIVIAGEGDGDKRGRR